MLVIKSWKMQWLSEKWDCKSEPYKKKMIDDAALASQIYIIILFMIMFTIREKSKVQIDRLINLTAFRIVYLKVTL